jgi:arylsulfatase A-like enzyme
MSRIVLEHCPQPIELTDMKEPFVWIERALDTHIPYGKIKHGNDIFTDYIETSGKEYIKSLAEGKINRLKEYQLGVKSVEKHFWDHIHELQTMDVYDNTLVVFTSDHGELLGEHWVGDVHNYPPCNELVEVPTVFINKEINCKFMRTIDIIPTAIGILKLKSKYRWDGVDIRDITTTKGVNISSYRGALTMTLWEYNPISNQVNLQKYFKKIRSQQQTWIPIPVKLVLLNRKLNPFKKDHRFLL